MWIDKDFPIAVSRIGINAFGFQIIDEATGTPVDITGMTVRFVIADEAGGSEISVYPDIVPVDPANGGFDWYIDGADLSSVPGKKEKVTVFYNGFLVNGQEFEPFVRGPMTIVPGV